MPLQREEALMAQVYKVAGLGRTRFPLPSFSYIYWAESASSEPSSSREGKSVVEPEEAKGWPHPTIRFHSGVSAYFTLKAHEGGMGVIERGYRRLERAHVDVIAANLALFMMDDWRRSFPIATSTLYLHPGVWAASSALERQAFFAPYNLGAEGDEKRSLAQRLPRRELNDPERKLFPGYVICEYEPRLSFVRASAEPYGLYTAEARYLQSILPTSNDIVQRFRDIVRLVQYYGFAVLPGAGYQLREYPRWLCLEMLLEMSLANPNLRDGPGLIREVEPVSWAAQREYIENDVFLNHFAQVHRIRLVRIFVQPQQGGRVSIRFYPGFQNPNPSWQPRFSLFLTRLEPDQPPFLYRLARLEEVPVAVGQAQGGRGSSVPV